MSDHAEFSSLIGDIYDAALDPSRWPAVLLRTCDYVGGSTASLFAKDASRQSGMVFYQGGDIDQRYRQLYFDKYVQLDPLNSVHVLTDVEQPVSITDIMPVEDFYQTRFYREWAQPQDLVDFVSVALDKSATETALFGVFRKSQQGLVDDETRQRVKQIAPHLRRSALIGRVIEQKTAEAANFATTFDGLSAAMYLVDASGRIVYANPSGHALVADGAVVCASGGKLASADKSAAQVLNEVFVNAADGDLALGTRGIFMPLAARDGQRYAVHVLPLTSGARRATGNGYAAAAAVFVRKATIDVPSAPEVIARHYRLTPTELRVLLAIVQVGGVPETAEALGVGETTVKTHLHRVFGKTGAARQADLVKLVAGFASPLAN